MSPLHVPKPELATVCQKPGTRVLLCWLAASLAAVACTGASPASVPDEAAAPGSDNGYREASVLLAELETIADSSAGRDRSDGANSGGHPVRSSISAWVGPPFGPADYYSGPGVVRDGVWISLGPNDVPGPLWDAPSGIRPRRVGQVFDVCVLEEAWIISYGYRPLQGVPAEFIGPWRRDKPECATIGDPGHELFARWSYVGETASGPYMRTKQEAFEWGRDYEELLRPQGQLLPWNADLLGIVSARNVNLLGFGEGADAKEPVEVLAASLSYDAGTLRGLVRNLSPTRFAHSVQVSLGDAAWRWPLSMQPGEIAPFELTGLSLAQQPSAGDLRVEAEMRDETDLSRAFNFSCSPPWFEGNATDLSGLVPDGVYETLPPSGNYILGYYCAYPDTSITSRPDWGDRQQAIEIEDLRSYVAFLEYGGQVIEIRELVTFTEYYIEGQDGRITPEVITSIPDESIFEGRNYRSSYAFVAFAAVNGTAELPANWVVWIGGAHPQPTA